eukprot:COSAG01_NODE_1979_length_8743_cov_18.850069_2_plen_106_part_00
MELGESPLMRDGTATAPKFSRTFAKVSKLKDIHHSRAMATATAAATTAITTTLTHTHTTVLAAGRHPLIQRILVGSVTARGRVTADDDSWLEAQSSDSDFDEDSE